MNKSNSDGRLPEDKSIEDNPLKSADGGNSSAFDHEVPNGSGTLKEIKNESLCESIINDDWMHPEVLHDKASSELLQDMEIWLPPQPAEMEGSVFLSDSHDSNREDNFDCDRNMDIDRALSEAKNVQFRELVNQSLASENSQFSSEKVGDNWLDMVVALTWEAALLIGPNATLEEDMDKGLLNIKCIPSGNHQESKVFKGLAFRKTSADGKMKTKYENPRLLLLKGFLGDSDNSLTSSVGTTLGKDKWESDIDRMIELCKPNVVLAEDTSEKIQKLFLDHDVTLISHMKLKQLERIAQCLGATVLSLAEALKNHELMQCKELYFEEIVESHISSGEPAKMPNLPSALMFLVGLPRFLGCTILLKGSTLSQLKLIKRVIRNTVLAAYHLVLQTSFIEDQRVMLNSRSTPAHASLNVTEKVEINHSVHGYSENNTLREASSFVNYSKEASVVEAVSYGRSQSFCNTQYRANDFYHPTNIHNDGVLAAHFRDKDNHPGGEFARSSVNAVLVSDMSSETQQAEKSLEQNADSTMTVDKQDILTVMSRRCLTKHRTCVRDKFTRIKYYGYQNVSLWCRLNDILYNQQPSCPSCGEPPEAHEDSYIHRNGRLTICIKQLPENYILPGQYEGKIWMWARCKKCEGSGIPTLTSRLSLSSAACKYSFGKFLELTSGSHSAAWKLLKCGHSLDRDCLRFFGIGQRVGMFRYSPVEIYDICWPLRSIEFQNEKQHLCEHVLAKGKALFSNVTDFMKPFNMTYPELKEVLRQEEGDFEANVNMVVADRTYPHYILNFNWLYQQLLLLLYIWDNCIDKLLKNERSVPKSDALLSCSPNSTSVEVSKISSIGAISDDAAQHNTIQMSEDVDDGGFFVSPNLASNKIKHESASECEVSVSSGLPNGNAWEIFQDSSFTILFDKARITEAVGHEACDGQLSPVDKSVGSKQSSNLALQDAVQLIRTYFVQSRIWYKKDVQAGKVETFHLINNYIPKHLPPMREIPFQASEGTKFTLGLHGTILSISEDAISSIIAHALAQSEGLHISTDNGQEVKVDDSHNVASDDLLKTSYDLPSLSPNNLHPEIFVDRKLALQSIYSVTCIFAKQFCDLRKKFHASEVGYIASLSQCRNWNAQGGKSKAFFAKTTDNRFVIKQIKQIEYDSFLQFGPKYFEHVIQSVEKRSESCLAKIFGIYRVKQIKSGKELKFDLMVMENLLFMHTVQRTYDLKGAIFARHVNDSHAIDTVYLDQNFIEDMQADPIYLTLNEKRFLARAIQYDTIFLTNVNVMDYSLLVGVDYSSRKLVVGIIDYLRQYTWDKQLETWVKSSLVMPKNTSPTVISPKQYSTRLRNFFRDYFLNIPKIWDANQSLEESSSAEEARQQTLEKDTQPNALNDEELVSRI